jgi:hypothetical protein
VGYLWFVVAWLAFGDKAVLTRPRSGPMATLWDLGTLAGRPAVLGAVTFVAYLLGALLEMNPERLWRYGGRPDWVSGALQRRKATSWLLESVRMPALSPTSQKDIAYILGSGPDGINEPINRMLSEIRQLATRLQASHPDLYDKYDRLLAEARFRFNIAVPVAVLLMVFAVQAHGHAALLVAAGVAVVGICGTLLRQVATRVAQANDVIAQAFIAGLVTSSLTPARPADTALSSDES